MADEHESAVAAWLDDSHNQREVGIVRKRFSAWRESDCYLFALMLHVFVKLDFYEPPATQTDDDDDGERWRGEATGFTP